MCLYKLICPREHISETTVRSSTIFHACYTYGSGQWLGGGAICCLSGFMDDVMFTQATQKGLFSVTQQGQHGFHTAAHTETDPAAGVKVGRRYRRYGVLADAISVPTDSASEIYNFDTS